jgi:hypothetical protein
MEYLLLQRRLRRFFSRLTHPHNYLIWLKKDVTERQQPAILNRSSMVNGGLINSSGAAEIRFGSLHLVP